MMIHFIIADTLRDQRKKGFVARISADKLFDNGIDSADYFYSGIEVNKLRVFPDENNNGYSTLLAMGTTKKRI